MLKQKDLDQLTKEELISLVEELYFEIGVLEERVYDLLTDIHEMEVYSND